MKTRYRFQCLTFSDGTKRYQILVKGLLWWYNLHSSHTFLTLEDAQRRLESIKHARTVRENTRSARTVVAKHYIEDTTPDVEVEVEERSFD